MSIFYHSFLLGSKNKNKFGEINISDSNFLSSGGYVIVIQWLVRLYLYVEVIHELQISNRYTMGCRLYVEIIHELLRVDYLTYRWTNMV